MTGGDTPLCSVASPSPCASPSACPSSSATLTSQRDDLGGGRRGHGPGISTAVPDHALLVRTVYIGCGGQEAGQAVDVTLARDGRATAHRVLPGVPVTHARGRCLSDHAAVVQGHLEALTGEQVSVHISDDAFILASQSYPPPEGPQQPRG